MSADSSVFEIRGAEDATVGGDDVAGLQDDEVAVDELVGRYGVLGAVAADAYEPARHRRAQSVDRLLGTQSLRRADDRVDAEHAGDEHAVAHRAGDGRERAHRRRAARQRIGELLRQERREARTRRPMVRRSPCLGVFGRQSRRSGSQQRGHVVGTERVPRDVGAVVARQPVAGPTLLPSTRRRRARRVPRRSSQPSRVVRNREQDRARARSPTSTPRPRSPPRGGSPCVPARLRRPPTRRRGGWGTRCRRPRADARPARSPRCRSPPRRGRDPAGTTRRPRRGLRLGVAGPTPPSSSPPATTTSGSSRSHPSGPPPARTRSCAASRIDATRCGPLADGCSSSASSTTTVSMRSSRRNTRGSITRTSWPARPWPSSAPKPSRPNRAARGIAANRTSASGARIARHRERQGADPERSQRDASGVPFDDTIGKRLPVAGIGRTPRHAPGRGPGCRRGSTRSHDRAARPRLPEQHHAVAGVDHEPGRTLAETVQQRGHRDDGRLEIASMLERAPHWREVVERGKRGRDLDRKPGKPCRARDDAERHPGGVGTELDRAPPQRSRVAGVIPTFDEHVVLGDVVRVLDAVDDGDEIIEPDGIFVEHDDDASKDRVHLRPMHALDGAQRPLERVRPAAARPGPMHTPRLDVRTTRRRPHMTPGRSSTGTIDLTRQNRRHRADRIQWCPHRTASVPQPRIFARRRAHTRALPKADCSRRAECPKSGSHSESSLIRNPPMVPRGLPTL